MSTSYSSSLRERSLPRKQQEMSRSGSFLGAIKNIVSTPLSWWGSSDRVEEPVKRRRSVGRASSDDEREEAVEQRPKRMRMMGSPEGETTRSRPATMGYLDPPAGTFPAARRRQNPTNSIPPLREDKVLDMREFGYAPFAASARMMSVDPPSRHTSIREGSSAPLPEPSPIRSSFSLGPREVSVKPPYSSLKLRSSLTPQPSSARPVRREASAPPPLSSLQSRPKFVRAPPEDTHPRDPDMQKTVSLGALADMMGRRTSRSPTRDRTLTSLGSISTLPFESSDSIPSNAAPPSSAEKALQVLEMYKTPILPSRHKEAKIYPMFLRPKRSHVPIPMAKKGRDSIPTLGLGGEKTKSPKRMERTRDAGKPYAGRSNLSKYLRMAEEEKEREQPKQEKSYRTDEDGDAEMESLRGSSKRDVGVSTQFSEDESRARKQEAIMRVAAGIAPMEALTDPYADTAKSRSLGGRNQPYGRVGRVRVREVGQRAVPLDRRVGKFSAYVEDIPEEATIDSQAMDTASDAGCNTEDAASKEDQRIAKPTFKAPEAFSFPAPAAIQHDTAGAKEPPLPSLPFSFTKPARQFTEEVDVKPIFPANAPAAPSEKPLQTASPTSMPAQTTASTAEAPKSSFAASPATKDEKAPSAPASGTVPNFFANSPFLAKSSPSAPATTTPTSTPPKFELPSSLAPGPSFTTSAKESDTPKATPPAPVVPKPLFGNAFNAFPVSTKSTGNVAGAPSPTFGAPSKPVGATSETSTTASPFGGHSAPSSAGSSTGASGTSPFVFGAQTASAKAPEADTKPSAPSASPFSFPTASDSTAKPLFGGQSSLSNATQAPTSNAEPKAAPFVFGAPTIANASSDSSAAPATIAPKPIFGGTNTFSFGTPSGSPTPAPEGVKPSTPFAFGAPPATPPASGESKSPFFGAPAPSSSSGSPFTFGATSKPLETSSVSTPVSSTPFTFGAPSARPTTPPSKPDEGMSMEASPTRTDIGAEQAKPNGGITLGFGATPMNPFAQSNGSSTPGFTFGAPSSVANTFAKEAPKVDTSSNAFNFNRTASAPAISTTFSFGQQSDVNTPPATAVGTSSNPFTQPPPSSGSAGGTAPFTFGQPSTSTNAFGAAAQPAAAAGSTPSSPFPTSGTFSFGAPTAAANPFAFVSSQPSSPAVQSTGLPTSPAIANSSGPAFTFGQSAGSSGSTLFNIGAAPTSNTTGGTPGRAMKKLPRRPPPRR